MKSSTILITTAIIFAFGILSLHNYALKASYNTGTFRNRFNHHDYTALKHFDELQLNGANTFSIVVEAGAKEGIWISERLKGEFKITQNNNLLVIEPTVLGTFHPSGKDEIVLITKTLTKIKTRPHYTPEQFKDKQFDLSGYIALSGLKTDSLNLQIGRSSGIDMDNVNVKSLRAVIGDKYGFSELVIRNYARIGSADFTVNGSSSLSLWNPEITKTHFNLSDESTVNLNGKSAHNAILYR